MSEINKQREQLEVFKHFIKKCDYYQVKQNTIKSKTHDGPDIECTLIDRTKKYFELSEIIDLNYQKRKKDLDESEEVLRQAFEKDSEFHKVFQNKKLSFLFSKAYKNTRQLKTNLNSLKDYLISQYTKGETQISLLQESPNPFPFINNIDTSASKYGLKVHVRRGQSIESPEITIIERIQNKFTRKYQPGCDLILYFWKLTAFDKIAITDKVIELVQEEYKTGNYQKVWVFSYSSNTILYEYPK